MPLASDNTSVRVRLDKILDDKEYQRAVTTGRKNEKFGSENQWSPMRAQSYPMSSHPPVGSHGLMTALNGNPDQTIIHYLEHHEYRPKDIPEGQWRLYDKFNVKNYLHAYSDRWIMEHSNEIVIRVGNNSITINHNGIFLKGVLIETDGVTRLDKGTARVHRIGDVDSALDIATTGAPRVYS